MLLAHLREDAVPPEFTRNRDDICGVRGGREGHFFTHGGQTSASADRLQPPPKGAHTHTHTLPRPRGLAEQRAGLLGVAAAARARAGRVAQLAEAHAAAQGPVEAEAGQKQAKQAEAGPARAAAVRRARARLVGARHVRVQVVVLGPVVEEPLGAAHARAAVDQRAGRAVHLIAAHPARGQRPRALARVAAAAAAAAADDRVLVAAAAGGDLLGQRLR